MATNDAFAKTTSLDESSDSFIGKKVYKRAYTGMSIDQDRDVGDDAAVLWRIFKLAAHQRTRLVLATIGILAAAIFQLMIPQFLGNAVDGAVGLLGETSVPSDRAKEALYSAAWLLLGASILRGAFTLIHNYCGETLGHYLAYRLRLAFYNKLQHLNFSVHDSVHTG